MHEERREKPEASSASLEQKSQVREGAKSAEAEFTFKDFIAKHGRKYDESSEEYAMREALFQKRFAAVQAQNLRPNARWKAAATRFSDFTDAERAMMRGYRRSIAAASRSASALETAEPTKAKAKPQQLAETVSWTHLNVARDIKDQGGCGSCWAIATSSVLEAHYEIYSAKGGKTRSFSPQQILECTPNPNACGGTGGCEGATVELGMAWVLEHGVATEDEVPYEALDGRCSMAAAKKADSKDDFKVLDKNAAHSAGRAVGGAAFGLASWMKLTPNEDHPLAEAVVTYGPVAVSAAASDWFEYSNGIFDSCDQDAVVDHAIVLYGYGVEGGTRYWLIRNSWGADWGESGFIRVLRHNEGEKYCGTDHDPSEGTGCKGGPSSVTVCGMCGLLYDSVVPHFNGSPLKNSSSSMRTFMGASTAATEDVSDIISRFPPNEDKLVRLSEGGQAINVGADAMLRREVRRHE